MLVEVPGSHLCLNLVVQKLLVEPGEGVVGAVIVQVQGVQHVPVGASSQPGAPELQALMPHTTLPSQQGSVSHVRGQTWPMPGGPRCTPNGPPTPQAGHRTQVRPKEPSNCIFSFVMFQFLTTSMWYFT